MAKGYLLPTVINPTENEYVIVVIPKDDRYRQAFWDNCQRLGYWFSWERDPQKLGKDAAERWRVAMEETFELWERIGNLSPLTINVNCGSGSGTPSSVICNNLISFDLDLSVHIGQETLDEINALPGGNMDDGVLPPIPDTTYQQYLELKCAYANQMAVDIYNSWDNLASLGLSAAAMSFPAFAAMLSSGAFASSLVGLLGGIVTAGTIMTVALGALVGIGAIFGISAYLYFEQLQQQMSVDDLRCALYGASSAEDARERVAGTFYNWGVNAALLPIANGALLDAFVYLARAMTPVTLLEPLFDATAYVYTLPIADCTLCTPVDPGQFGDGTGLLTNLVAHWPMTEATAETRVDAHGSHDLAPVNNPAAILDGPNNRVANHFVSGSSQGMLRADADFDLNLPFNQPRTFAVWVRLTTLNSGVASHLLWARSNSVASQRNYWVNVSNAGQIGVHMYDTNYKDVTSGAYNLDAGYWHMVLWQCDGAGGIKIFVDGDIEVGSGTLGNNLANAGMDIDFRMGYGAQPDSGAHRLNGDMCLASVWHRVLTGPEKDNLYNSGFGLSYAQYEG